MDLELSVAHQGTTRYSPGKLLGWCDVEANPDIRKGTMKYISVNQIEKNFCTITLCYLCGRNVFQHSSFLGKQLSSCGVYTCRGTVFVVKHNHKSFNNCKCCGVDCHGFELVTRDILEGVRYLGYAFHACHTLFFPLPKNEDVASHPENAWNIGNALALLSPDFHG